MLSELISLPRIWRYQPDIFDTCAQLALLDKLEQLYDLLTLSLVGEGDPIAFLGGLAVDEEHGLVSRDELGLVGVRVGADDLAIVEKVVRDC